MTFPILKNFSNPIYHIKRVNNRTVYFAEGDGYPFKVELQQQPNDDIHFKILEQKLGKSKIVGNGNAKHPLHGIFINETKEIIFSYRLTDWTQIPGNYTVEGAKET